jgi:hypothetical protein
MRNGEQMGIGRNLVGNREKQGRSWMRNGERIGRNLVGNGDKQGGSWMRNRERIGRNLVVRNVEKQGESKNKKQI